MEGCCDANRSVMDENSLEKSVVSTFSSVIDFRIRALPLSSYLHETPGSTVSGPASLSILFLTDKVRFCHLAWRKF